MYAKVLVALDLSESSEKVVAAARDLAFLAKSEVWMLHLQEREPDPRIGMVAKESYGEAQAAICRDQRTRWISGPRTDCLRAGARHADRDLVAGGRPDR